MPFSNRKFDPSFFTPTQEAEPPMVENVRPDRDFEDQPTPSLAIAAIAADAVFVRTEAGLAEIAQRSMRVDFRHRMMLIAIDDFSSASRYFGNFGGQGAAILQSLHEQGFIAERDN